MYIIREYDEVGILYKTTKAVEIGRDTFKGSEDRDRER